MRFIKTAILATTMLSASATLAYADVRVVASIKPVHSLVSGVMQGVGTPDLLVDGAGSPHNYALKPSQARQLQEADIVFWVGHDLEAFLENSIENIASDAVSVPLINAHDLIKLSFREGGAFDAHDHADHDDHHSEHKHDDHDDHGHTDDHDEHHDEHKHDDHDDHGHTDDHADHDDHHDEHKHDDHDDHGHTDDHADHDDHHDEHKHDDHDDHGHTDDHDDHDDEQAHDAHEHGTFDSHIWLDPQNAKALVHEIAEHLAEIDPAHAALYEANAQAMMDRLDALTTEISAELAPMKGRGYVVFHDAYQYFENRFGLSAIGSITVSPEVMPGADRIRELQQKVRKLDATCVFSEPQFQPKLVLTVTENTNAGTGVLDPLGATIKDGPELYFTLLRNMAASLKTCLQKTS